MPETQPAFAGRKKGLEVRQQFAPRQSERPVHLVRGARNGKLGAIGLKCGMQSLDEVGRQKR